VEGLAVSGDTVYANVVRYLNPAGGQATGVLVALDRRDGHELWRWQATGTAHSFLHEPIVAGRFVVVDDILGSAVHAFDPVAQREVWQVPHSSATRLYLHDGVVFVAGVGGYAKAIDASTGVVRWNAEPYSAAFGGAYCAGSFYMDESRLIRFDAVTGRKTGQLATDPPYTFSSDLATDGASVFFTGPDGAYRVDCT
jgi:outer membrane protein assembly factor BamB